MTRHNFEASSTADETKTEISEQKHKRKNVESRLEEIYVIIDGLKNHPMQYDDKLVRQLIECVVVESKEQIKVIFVGGLEVKEILQGTC